MNGQNVAHPHHRIVLKKKEILMPATTCMNLVDITLSEIRCKKTNTVRSRSSEVPRVDEFIGTESSVDPGGPGEGVASC